ncbi:MAG TPA: glycoside hydrolase family 3 N-terminal domain-containing protein [Pyrinomonadaceae bacterium]|jgi:beta-N-acetylhexosaminidase
MSKLFASIFFFVCIQLVVPFSIHASPGAKYRPDEKAYKWADKQLKKMTLDEKIGQLVHIGINAQFLSQDSNEYKELKRQIVENKVGGIIVFVGGVYDTVHLVNRMQAEAKIPLLISGDFETGVGMRFPDTVNFPWNMAIAATGNPDFARRQGAIVGRESKALGVHQVFAPVVDVNNNADNPVINVRSYGENVGDVSRFAAAFTEGLQSENVLATAKHFPGHGDTAVDSHRGLPVIDYSRERLERTEFAPFRALINAGIGSVMISHISMPKLDNTKVEPLKQSIKPSYADSEVITEGTTMPATLSKDIVTGILRNDMNFDGLIVTDAMDMSGLTLYFTQEEGSARAIMAGNDVLLKPANADAAIKGVREAVQSGRITEERLDQSVRKILAWKYKLGLSEKKITPIEAIDTTVSSSATRQLTDEIAQNAITLVKAEENVLPLKNGAKALVLCITNGEDRNYVGNTLTTTLRQNGLKVERVVIDERATEKEIADAIAKVKSSEIVIAGLYGRVRSGAKNSIGLPASGEKVLREALASNAKVISAAFGNPYLLRGFPEMKTYIVSYGDMTSLQRATGNALTGKIDFKGKMPITVGSYERGTGLSLNRAE